MKLTRKFTFKHITFLTLTRGLSVLEICTQLLLRLISVSLVPITPGTLHIIVA